MQSVYLSQCSSVSPLGLTSTECLSSLKLGKNCLQVVPRGVVPSTFPLNYIGLLPNQKMSAFCEKNLDFENNKKVWIESLFSEINFKNTTIDMVIFVHNDSMFSYEYYRRVNDTFYDRPKISLGDSDFLDVLSKSAHISRSVQTIDLHNTCSSSVAAIVLARNYIAAGLAKSCLIVAYEVSNHFYPVFINLSSLGALNTRATSVDTASTPFSDDRSGFIKADAIGCMLIQNEECAQKSHQAPLAKIRGAVVTSDCHSLTDGIEDGSMVQKTIELCLQEANIAVDQIDYINAHGSGTYLNDKIEMLGLKKVFHKTDKKIFLSSNKSQLGHALCAAGAVEVDAILKMFQHKFIAGNLNFNSKEDIQNFIIPEKPVLNKEITFALKNSFGFGGYNASIIFENLSR